ncbi:MAG: hypothetical protein NTV72_03310 [Candidatus Taylorbacteria bacterium]|nr:hypothetical protein [Candidatus Taylorbacteria bacterium]
MKNTTVAVIVDMQDFFLQNMRAEIRSELIENQKKVIDLCLKSKMPFIIIEYK